MNFDKRIALIDSDTLIFYACFNKKDSLVVKTLDDCKKHIDELIFNILNYTKATHYILTLTTGKTNFRYSVRTDYKSNRVGEKPNYFKEVKQYLIDEYKAQYNEYIESDDIVNIYKNKLPNSFICACDSDILEGLEGTHFNYRKFEWITTNKQQAEYKFWCDMIAGTHNGISGLKGKGIKYAENILSDLTNPESDFRYHHLILDAYIEYYKDEPKAIEEFYKNYKCLKILDEYDGLIMIEPIEFNKYEEEYKLVD